MGYDLNKFVDVQDIPNHLLCTICSLVLQDPLQAPLCEHYFCSKCISIHLQATNHCPHHDEDSVSVKSDKKKSPLRKMSFRKIIGKSPKDKLPVLKLSDLKSLPESALEELNNLKVNCDFHLNGCKEKLVLSTLNNHTKQCRFVDEVKENSVKSVEHKQQTNQSISTQKSTTNQNQIGEQPSTEQKSKENRTSSEITIVVDQSNTMDNKRTAKRKDSEAKSLNGETNKLVSEEEVGSDDFVVIPKNVSSSAKSTESVQTNSSDPSAMIESAESKENVYKSENDPNTVQADKKKKKKKKKKTTKTDEDAVSLDTGSLKDVESASSGRDGSKTQSKESLVETEEIKRALKESETKSDNLRLINNQLLGQIKQLKEQKDEFTKKLQSQVGKGEIDELRSKVQQLEKENKSQALRIIQLLDNNEQMSKFIGTLREEQSQLKERYNQTLCDVQQISKLVKTCKQEVK